MPKWNYLPRPETAALTALRTATAHGELEAALAALLSELGGTAVTPGLPPVAGPALAVRLVAGKGLAAGDPSRQYWTAELAGRSPARESFCFAFSRLMAAGPLARQTISTAGGSQLTLGEVNFAAGAEFGAAELDGRIFHTAKAQFSFAVELAAGHFAAAPGREDELAALQEKLARCRAWDGAAATAALLALLERGGVAVRHYSAAAEREGLALRLARELPTRELSGAEYDFELSASAWTVAGLFRRFAAVRRLLPAETESVPLGDGTAALGALFATGELNYRHSDLGGRSRFNGVLPLRCRLLPQESRLPSVLPEPAAPATVEVDPAALEKALPEFLGGADAAMPVRRGGALPRPDGVTVEFVAVDDDGGDDLVSWRFAVSCRVAGRDEALNYLGELRRRFPAVDFTVAGTPVVVAELPAAELRRLSDQGKFKYQLEADLLLRIPAFR